MCLPYPRNKEAVGCSTRAEIELRCVPFTNQRIPVSFMSANKGNGTSATGDYPVPLVIPNKHDFLLIKPGGRWLKVRQQSAWNSERLGPLAAPYAQIPKAESAQKRTFVQTQIIQPVHQQGGRFLRGHVLDNGRVWWQVVTNEDGLEDDVMRILRNLQKLQKSNAKKLETTVAGITAKVQHVRDILAVVHMTLEQRCLSGQKRRTLTNDHNGKASKEKKGNGTTTTDKDKKSSEQECNGETDIGVDQESGGQKSHGDTKQDDTDASGQKVGPAQEDNDHPKESFLSDDGDWTIASARKIHKIVDTLVKKTALCKQVLDENSVGGDDDCDSSLSSISPTNDNLVEV